MTQKEQIQKYLEDFGEITSWEAFELFGITRLSDVIYRMKKDGFVIASIPKTVKTRLGTHANISVYKLIKKGVA